MRLSLFPTVQAPGEARRRLAPLAERIEKGSLADVKAVVSELVTISVAHGASEPIDMSLELEASELRGVVEDHGPGARALVRARERKDDSLVLRIVDALVDEWGTDEDQKRIWFRMSVEPRIEGEPENQPPGSGA